MYLNNANETEVVVQDYWIHTVVYCNLWWHRYRELPSKNVPCLWWSHTCFRVSSQYLLTYNQKQCLFVNFLRSADVLRSMTIILLCVCVWGGGGGWASHDMTKWERWNECSLCCLLYAPLGEICDSTDVRSMQYFFVTYGIVQTWTSKAFPRLSIFRRV
jgi:hypothetical protein